MHDTPRRAARARTTRIAAAMCIVAAGLAGCTYYATPYPAPYTVAAPASFDRSWDAAAAAMADNGVAITAQDRSAGMLTGRRGGIEIVTQVRTQADGSVRVEFNARGNIAEDRGLIERVSAAYDRRMGR